MTVSSLDSPLLTPPLDVRPGVDHLVTEDDTPVDNLFSEKQQRLLTEPLYASWPGPGQGRSFLAAANVGLFYAVEQSPFVPDVLLSLDVRCSDDLWPKSHRSYFMWEYGKPPDVVIEIVSNRRGGEDSDKLRGYAQIRIPYYAIFDPERMLSDEILRACEWHRFQYRPLDDPGLLPGIGLGLRSWHGVFENHDNTWLRWIDAEGKWIATGGERAERAEQRADKLVEQLRRLGVEPEV
ncbi:MAG: Uma2 family endonuclease [Candidatus Anammoximicrobium sp.]|nr:Uma2 family endonuclease [Candidatus Anammoximicrobium sp.]